MFQKSDLTADQLPIFSSTVTSSIGKVTTFEAEFLHFETTSLIRQGPGHFNFEVESFLHWHEAFISEVKIPNAPSICNLPHYKFLDSHQRQNRHKVQKNLRSKMKNDQKNLPRQWGSNSRPCSTFPMSVSSDSSVLRSSSLSNFTCHNVRCAGLVWLG